MKREYLHHMARQYTESPSSFSGVIQSLLRCQSVERTREEATDLIDKIIDAWFLGPRHGQNYTFQSIDGLGAKDALETALAMSAIFRNDPIELQKVIEVHLGQPPWSGDLEMDLLSANFMYGFVTTLDVAAKHGTADITVLIANRDNFKFARKYWFKGRFVNLMANKENWAGLKAWIEFFKVSEDNLIVFPGCTHETLTMRLRPAIYHCLQIGNFDMMDFIVEECESETDEVKEDLHFDILMQAIRSGEVDAVEYALETKRLDMREQLRRYNYFTPLFQALFECQEATKVAIMGLLLEYGADPLQPHHNTKRIPLEYALRQGNFLIDSVQLLWNHEMKLFGTPSLLLSSPARKSYWLRIAFANRYMPFVDVLLRHGTSSVLWRGIKYTIQEIDSTIVSICKETDGRVIIEKDEWASDEDQGDGHNDNEDDPIDHV
ncbi:uncharacterized protein N7483_009249 [Penicillium malachiteum]|uniref:uncharacterized protein n=1 Tax=Penicillium malachiteum TaxID=1324776 RepID=UPI002549A5E7|nr:uncharacterized protein N7483_009249 [Penicillium malachiteum]KAJ5721315.1 hypothetical protein N7483_009249 [Penicillium malachiteum]